MGFCDNADKILNKRKNRGRKTSHSTGRNAGHRYRQWPIQESKLIDWIVYQPEDGVLTPDPSTIITPLPDGAKHREMWDTHGFIQNWYNPCTKEVFEYGGASAIPPIEDADGIIISFETTSPSFKPLVRDTYPFLSEIDLDELALRSEEKLTTIVETEVSIVNFIIELIQTCQGNVSKINKFAKIFNRARRLYHLKLKELLKKGVKETSAKWLAWNFAIKPAISDLKAILCSVSNAYKKLKWLKDHNHKIVYLDYTRDDLAENISFSPNEWHNGSLLCAITRADPLGTTINGGYYQQVRFTELKLKYHARSKIYLSIPDDLLDGMKGMGALWSAMQGLYNPVGIVWEAIPFSWLVDYFLSYRARLFQRIYDFNPFDAGVEVLGFGHSFDISVVGAARVQNITHDVTHHDYGRFEYTLYVRSAGLPKSEQSTLFRVPLTWYQTSIIGAVGAGILPGRRR